MINGLIITVNLRGSIKGPVSNASRKNVIRKVKSSPFERIVRGEKNSIRYLTPENHFSVNEPMNYRGYEKCVVKHVIPGSVVKSWTHNDPPSWCSAKKWQRMSPKERIDSFISKYDDGFGVSIETL